MRPEWARRMWGAPLLVHAAALALLLVALASGIGTHTSLSEDEGAAIVQARQLAEHHTWVVPDPAPAVDPAGRFYPYRLADVGVHGPAPFARHPAYALLLAGLWDVGGINMLVALSLASTVVAALVAARLATGYDPKLARPSLWAVGVGSPLLFDGFLVIAHTVAAACAGGLVLALMRRGHQRVTALGAGVLAAALVLVRTEALLFVGAAALVGFVFRESRVVAIGTGVGGAAAAVGNALWTRHILGPVVTVASSGGGAVGQSHDLASRVHGAVTTLVRFTYGDGPRANVLLLVATVATAAAGCLAKRRPPLAVVLAWLAAALWVARLGGRPAVIPGLFVVCPLLWAGLWSGAFGWRSPATRLPIAVCGAFAIAVLATQYAEGGGIEWGGRYFALAVPIALVIALRGLASAPKAVLAALAVASLATAAAGGAALRSSHRHTAELLDAIPHHGLAITTAGLLPRLDWPYFDDRQWLLVTPRRVPLVLQRLHDAGVDRVAVVYPNALTPPGFADRGKPVAGLPWRVAEVTP